MAAHSSPLSESTALPIAPHGNAVMEALPRPIPNSAISDSQREDFSEYVAHLQLHMALQTRNLLPSLNQDTDSRNELIEQTQASVEKQVSRQIF